MSAISVEHLSRWWGPTRAVDDVSFEAAAGKMLVLLGPSGCGKSTTLRLIAGLEIATAGEKVDVAGDYTVEGTGPVARREPIAGVRRLLPGHEAPPTRDRPSSVRARRRRRGRGRRK